VAADDSAWSVLRDWRSVFFISAATLAVMALLVSRMLKSSPHDVGAPEPPANPANVFGERGDAPQPESVASLLRPLLASRLFWMICLMNVGLTLIRESFNFWTPTIFREAVGMSAGRAAQYSSLFPLMGAVAAVLAGMGSDWLGGRHGRVLAPCILLLVVALGGLAAADLHNRPLLASVLLGGVAFFLLAPYSYLAGVMALDLGGKRGSSSAAGLIDSAGYLGAILSGVAVGRLAQEYGWNTTVGCLTVVAAATGALGIVYWVQQERQAGR
jgi:MFS transporter, OPA family, glycerol-3-phosphate transporter